MACSVALRHSAAEAFSSAWAESGGKTRKRQRSGRSREKEAAESLIVFKMKRKRKTKRRSGKKVRT